MLPVKDANSFPFRTLDKQSKSFLTFLGIVFVLCIGLLDYITGKEISFSIFYLLPVAFTSWFAGKKSGISSAVLSVAAWLVADIAAGDTYSNPFIPIWNTVVRFGFFITMCLLLSSLKAAIDRERTISRIIAHDLKNPLIAIMGFANRLKEGKGRLDKAAQVILESAQNMQEIVNDVLDFNKPFNVNLREEDIISVINHAADICRAEAANKGVDLVFKRPYGPVNILIDKYYFERALINLISNAVDASVKGQDIVISAENEKSRAVIKIKDHGSGMDKETIRNVFIPFYTKKSSGTGLGMPIAKQIIEGHKGKIKIESNPGTGTEVRIEMPVLVISKKT
jgi:signal transduction histidine kinase